MIQWFQDREYDLALVKEVEIEGDSVAIHQEDGWTFGMPLSLTANKLMPKPGDQMVLWGRGVGYTIRGIGLLREDRMIIYRYSTEEESRAELAAEIQKRDNEKREKFEAEREERDAKVEALPDVFRWRIRHFQEIGGPEFRWQHEPYEVFVCEQAKVFADALKTVEAIVDFKGQAYDEQRKRVPDMSDEHSGNTFDCACYLAAAYLRNDTEAIITDHGAMAPLHGTYRKG